MTDNTKRNGMVLILSGPSGSGKSTLYKRAFAVTGGFEFSVSCTTRSPREGELDGIDYHFKTREQFTELLKQDAFAEHAEVHGNYYGTLKSELLGRLEKGIDVLLDIDVQGAMQLRELCKKDPRFADACVFVFVMPPSYAELEKRLRGRGSETEETLARRLKNARQEMTFWKEYDYVILNDQLEEASERFTALINTMRLAVRRMRKEPFDGE